MKVQCTSLFPSQAFCRLVVRLLSSETNSVSSESHSQQGWDEEYDHASIDMQLRGSQWMSIEHATHVSYLSNVPRLQTCSNTTLRGVMEVQCTRFCSPVRNS